MDGDRVKDALDRRAAHLALGHRVVGHRLDDLEAVAVVAAVLVDRHARRLCSSRRVTGNRRPPEYLCSSADGRHRSKTAAPTPRRGRRAVQAPRLHLPLVGDLRRRRLDLRLRPLRRAAEEQRQGRVVARDAHDRDDIVAIDSAIIQHPRVWEASGHLGRVQRPDGRLQDLQAALSRRPPRDLPVRQEAVEAPRRGPRLRAHRGARVQPHVRDHGRPGRGLELDRLPAPGDRAGHLHQLQERAPVRAQASRRSGSRRSASRFATRSRPATSSSAPASSSRWRWSSSARPTRPRSGTSTGWTSGCAGTPTSASAPTT